MAKQRLINTKFWSDGFVVDQLNPLDRYLFLYLMTNEKTNVSGIYQIPLTVISRETGIDRETLPVMFRTLAPKVYYFQEWVILKNFVKNQNFESPKIKIGISNELSDIPKEVLEYAISIGYTYGIDTYAHLNLNSNLNSNTKEGLEVSLPSPVRKTKTHFLNERRKEKGLPPAVPRRSMKQVETTKALLDIDYFKSKGYEMHGMQFFKVESDDRNKVARKLFIKNREVLGDDIRPLIDWWFSGAGEFCDYSPEVAMSVKVVEKFQNSKRKIKNSEEDIFDALKAIR